MPANPGCRIPLGELKGFLDIVTMEDFWDWMQLFLVPRFYQTAWDNGDAMQRNEVNTVMRKLRPIHGPRLVITRAVPGSASVSPPPSLLLPLPVSLLYAHSLPP
jgi:hypothetical protein